MLIAVGVKAHSGWASIVALGKAGKDVQIVDRRRIDLVDPLEASWAKQPYHAGERLPVKEAKQIALRGLEAAEREAKKEVSIIIRWAAAEGHEIKGCGIVVGSPMPNWSTEQILTVHVRMHKAEGMLFPQAVAAAARNAQLHVVEIPEKDLTVRASASLSAAVIEKVMALGKTVGPPWGKDQKSAAIAALMVLGATSEISA